MWIVRCGCTYRGFSPYPTWLKNLSTESLCFRNWSRLKVNCGLNQKRFASGTHWMPRIHWNGLYRQCAYAQKYGVSHLFPCHLRGVLQKKTSIPFFTTWHFFLHYHLSPDRPVPILPFLLAVFEGGLCGTSSTSLYMCDRNVTTRRVWNIQTKVIPPKRGSQQNALGTGLWISDMFNELGEWLAFFYFRVSPLGSNKVLLNKQLLLNVRQLFFSFFSILIFFPQEDWKEDAFCGSAVWQLFVLQQQFLLIIKTLSWKWNDCLVFM